MSEPTKQEKHIMELYDVVMKKSRRKKMKMRLKKDIVIKAGTVFDTAAISVSRDPDSFVECVFGLTKDTYGIVTYEVGDKHDMRDTKHRRAIRRWFEDVK